MPLLFFNAVISHLLFFSNSFLIILKLKDIYNINFSIIFLISLFFIPSFSGHMLFNVKDIPHLLNMFWLNYIFMIILQIILKSYLFLRLSLGFITAASLSIRINALVFYFFSLLLLLFFQKIKVFSQNISG